MRKSNTYADITESILEDHKVLISALANVINSIDRNTACIGNILDRVNALELGANNSIPEEEFTELPLPPQKRYTMTYLLLCIFVYAAFREDVLSAFV